MALPNDIAGEVTAGVVEGLSSAEITFVVILAALVHDLVSPKQE